MQTNFELDRVYRLGDHTAIADASPPKYNGCGNGFIVIDKTTHDQNIAMCADAGTVLREDEAFITVRANFSCWSACLFKEKEETNAVPEKKRTALPAVPMPRRGAGGR